MKLAQVLLNLKAADVYFQSAEVLATAAFTATRCVGEYLNIFIHNWNKNSTHNTGLCL